MLLPLKDDNPLEIIPFQYVTVGIILACVVVFLLQLASEGAITADFGMVPAALLGGETASGAPVASAFSLITSIFMHGGWMHLIGNMLYLWVFGDNIEDAMGHGRFIAFFLACGVAGGLAHALANPDSLAPTIGASGAISGVLGAYLLLHPRVKVLVMAFTWWIHIRLPAYIVLGGWIVLQIANAIWLASPGSNTAWWAHIGGFAAGMALIVPLHRKRIPLFDRGRTPGPWSGKKR